MRYLGLLLVIFIVGRPALPVIDYVFNYDYIASELCINRERPELHCNGKCYLMQAMAQEAAKERQDKKGNLILRYELPVLYFEDSILTWEHFPSVTSHKKVIDSYQFHYTFLLNERNLRPPII